MDADAYIGRCRHGRFADGCAKCEDSALPASAAKTAAERQAAFRARKAESPEVRGIFAHPEDHQAIKEAAAKITRKRQRAEKRKDMP